MPVGAHYSIRAPDLAFCRQEVCELDGSFVIADQSAKDGFTAYSALRGEIDDLGCRTW